jgi:hypothetical protein
MTPEACLIYHRLLMVLTVFTKDAVRYEQKVFEFNPRLAQSSARTYAGEPSQELEDAWNQLLQCTSPTCLSHWKTLTNDQI